MFGKTFMLCKKKRSVKAWAVAGLFLTFFVIFGVFILFLATKDDYIDVYSETSGSGELACKIGTSILSCQEVTIKQEELNSFLNFFLKNKAKPNEFSDSALEGISVLKNNQNGNFKIYFPITKNGAHLGIVVDTCISFENKCLVFDIKNTKVGRLPVPRFIFFDLVKECLPKNLEIKNNSLLMPGNVSLEFMGSNLIFLIEELKFSKENIVSRFSADKKALMEFIENKARNFITGNVKDLFCKLV